MNLHRSRRITLTAAELEWLKRQASINEFASDIIVRWNTKKRKKL